MAIELLVPQLSWLLTVLCITIIIFLLAMCVCSKTTDIPSHEYGTAGRLSMTQDSPIFRHQATNGNVVTLKSVEVDTSPADDGSLKRNSWTVKDRALPDIPEANCGPIDGSATAVAAAAPTGGSTPVGAAAVVSEETNHKRRSHNKPVAPKPPAPEATLNESKEKTSGMDHPHVMKITVNDKALFVEGAAVPSSSSGSNQRPWSQDIESVPGTSDGSVVLKKIGNSNLHRTDSPSRRLSDSDAYKYGTVASPYADPQAETVSLSSSPVCIRIGVTHSPNDGHSLATPAGLAVAGAVPSSDIPYMTPPLLHNPPVSNEDSAERSTISTGCRSEVPYTVISVREPLARVKAMTMRKQRNIQQAKSAEDAENHYAMVPEEEQMYAEIGSGHASGSSSITYAHIEPRELPPVPPTVESLKSVAHAHSRQASTVSNSSFGSGMSSSAESTSPPQLRNPLSLYSTVDKNGKQRKTIHIAEGASILSTMEKHKKVEDLYAKVHKKRVDLTVSASSSEDYAGYQGVTGDDAECLTPPPSPWASTTPPAPPPITGRLQASSLGVLLSTGSQHIQRQHSADPHIPERLQENVTIESKRFSYNGNSSSNEPGYEQIYNEDDNGDDSCYEKIKDESLTENSHEVGYEKIHQPVDSQSHFSFLGYESIKDVVKDPGDPGYECVAQLGSEGNSSDPGYEPVRVSVNLEEDSDSTHGYTTVSMDDDSDPNYEIVKKLYRAESDAVDPGYEKVKKLHRNDSDATDPGYERVNNKLGKVPEPGYETVQRSDSDNEPGYEIVHHKQESNEGSCSKVQNSTPSEIPVISKSTVLCNASNSTVLFVSGDRQSSIKCTEQVSAADSEELPTEADSNSTPL